MNEAENSNSPDRFESSDSQNDSAQAGAIVSATVVQPDEEGWETVNFPNALSVDQIPHAEELEQATARILQLEHQCKAAIDHAQTMTQQHKVAVDRIRDLEQRNSELTLQVSRLEDALEQARKSVRLERRRWKTQILSQIVQTEEKLQAQAAIVAQKDRILTDAQHSVAKLFHELEQSHQTSQKQQILVETLTGQLESSQEQVAQLERECALTQQRYDDQIQTVRQAEHSCRDLRSRLHRQQRYTLQFKAALEKCLDVPAVHAQKEVSEIEEKLDAPVQLFAPKAQPVQPWSAQPDFLAIEPDQPVVLTPAAWEVEPEPTILESSALTDQPPLMLVDAETNSVELSDVVLSQPPTQPAPVSYTIKPTEDDALEETLQHWNIQLFNPPSDAPPEQPSPEPTDLEANVEQKLNAALQTFESSHDNQPMELETSFWESTEPAIADLPAPEVSDPALSDVSTPDLAETEITILESKVGGDQPASETLITPFEQVLLDHFAPVSDSSPFITLQPVAQSAEPAPEQTEAIPKTPFQINGPSSSNSSPFITLQPAAQSAEPMSEQTEEPPKTPFQSGPSPVVYPLRSTKKRQSLAAVELPSFPRRGS